jgi:hypothetical protein
MIDSEKLKNIISLYRRAELDTTLVPFADIALTLELS